MLTQSREHLQWVQLNAVLATTPAVAKAWMWRCQLARSPQVWIDAIMPGTAWRSARPVQ